MLTGRLPFEGDGVDVARANLLSETPVMAIRVPGLVVDPLLEGLTRKLMMKSRDARPPSARAVAELLDLIVRDRAAAATALGDSIDTDPMPPVPHPRPSGLGIPLPLHLQPTYIDETEPVTRPMRRGWLAVLGVAALTVITAAILASRPHQPRAAAPIAAEPAAAPVAPTRVASPAPPVVAGPAEVSIEAPAAPASPAAIVAIAAIREPPRKPVDRAAHVAARGVPASKPAAPPVPPPSDPPAAPTEREQAPPGEPPAPAAGSAVEPAAPPIAAPSEQHLELSAAPHALPSVTVPPSSERVARLYATVGKELKALDQARGSAATADLWLVYLRVRINDVIADPVKCAEADALLQHLDDQIAVRSR
jgi:hypothetical protein